MSKELNLNGLDKSVLNKRFLVEQEIDAHQKLYLRKDKF